MKTLRITIIIAIVSLILTGSYAQERQQHRQHPPIPNEKQVEQMISKFNEELKLTDKQANELKALFLDHFKELKNKLEKQRKAKKLEREEMEKFRKEFENSLQSLLSEEQAEKLKKIMHQNKPPAGRKHGQGN